MCNNQTIYEVPIRKNKKLGWVSTAPYFYFSKYKYSLVPFSIIFFIFSGMSVFFKDTEAGLLCDKQVNKILL